MTTNANITNCTTKNGASCIPTGRYFNQHGARIAKAENKQLDYVECQMLPIHPQRIERIRLGNLIFDRT